MNGILFQHFHWYYPNNGTLWKQVIKNAQELADLGITAIWLPPAFKGTAGKNDVGYGTYDLYDLGEFNQKGTVRTKYGTKRQYIKAIQAAHDAGIQVYADIVLNHKAGADKTERVKAIRVDWNNRNLEYGDISEIEAWTLFNFPGRKGEYSDFEWNHKHFDGVDWAENLNERSIFKIITNDNTNDSWDTLVDKEHGNYDYLMYADVDFSHPAVKKELKKWGKWYLQTTGVDGFRLDAVKHIRFDFFKEWLDYMRQESNKELFTVGEYWNSYDVNALLYYLEQSGKRMSLFDAPLHKNFFIAAQQGSNFDLRHIFSGTLTAHNPVLSVTIVENHDTQPLQSLESPVDWWFKPLAYALILLRKDGYPCVFYPDLYGATYKDYGHDNNKYEILLAPVPKLRQMLKARKLYAYGFQRDYFDHPNVIGWTREGIDEKPKSGTAVLISNSSGGSKWMEIGSKHKGKQFYDYLGNHHEKIQINQQGWGEFKVNGGSVSVWVAE